MAAIAAWWILFGVLRLGAQSQGTFRGELVRPPRGERAVGWLYLLGRDGNVRRILVSRAEVVYDAATEAKERRQPARRALVPGTEVRVTALLDSRSGEWTASRIEVIPRHVAEYEDQWGEDDGSQPSEIIIHRQEAMAGRTI